MLCSALLSSTQLSHKAHVKWPLESLRWPRIRFELLICFGLHHEKPIQCLSEYAKGSICQIVTFSWFRCSLSILNLISSRDQAFPKNEYGPLEFVLGILVLGSKQPSMALADWSNLNRHRNPDWLPSVVNLAPHILSRSALAGQDLRDVIRKHERAVQPWHQNFHCWWTKGTNRHPFARIISLLLFGGGAYTLLYNQGWLFLYRRRTTFP